MSLLRTRNRTQPLPANHALRATEKGTAPGFEAGGLTGTARSGDPL